MDCRFYLRLLLLAGVLGGVVAGRRNGAPERGFGRPVAGFHACVTRPPVGSIALRRFPRPARDGARLSGHRMPDQQPDVAPS